MNKKSIGMHAGRVWSLLSDGQKWDYDVLRDKLQLHDNDLNAALGWLAREDKIEFGRDGDHILIYQREAVGAANFFF